MAKKQKLDRGSSRRLTAKERETVGSLADFSDDPDFPRVAGAMQALAPGEYGRLTKKPKARKKK